MQHETFHRFLRPFVKLVVYTPITSVPTPNNWLKCCSKHLRRPTTNHSISPESNTKEIKKIKIITLGLLLTSRVVGTNTMKNMVKLL